MSGVSVVSPTRRSFPNPLERPWSGQNRHTCVDLLREVAVPSCTYPSGGSLDF